MKVRLLQKRRRMAHAWIGLRELELFFLVFGLIALDVYIWINTSTALYQAYDQWSFERRLPLAPNVPGAKIPPPALSLPETKPIGPPGVIGRLEIPSLHLTAMVREGADAATLRRAVGHIPGTALPGRIGNVGLAGHRDTFFRALRNIRRNDRIEIETQNGTYWYLVESTGVVGPRDMRVLASSNAESLTLVTCYPFYYVGSAPKRFIVHAVLASAGVKRPPT